MFGLGSDAIWQQNPGFDAGLKLKQYDYERRDETSLYTALILNFYGNATTQFGLEGGVMKGESSENRYRLGRAYLFWDEPFFYFKGAPCRGSFTTTGIFQQRKGLFSAHQLHKGAKAGAPLLTENHLVEHLEEILGFHLKPPRN